MKFERVWAMPNHRTFSIKPIKLFIHKHKKDGIVLDAFKMPYRRDALTILEDCANNSVNFGLYDPPYSQKQLVEMYEGLGQSVQVNSGYWKTVEDEWFRVMVPEGVVIRCGWNSKKMKGFEIIDGLVVSHGGQHNDTIVTAQRKILTTLTEEGECNDV